MTPERNTTQLLNDPASVNELLNRVWQRLEGVARKVKGGGTDPDSLVVKGLMKVLLHGEPREWESKREFFGVVANAMRQVVIDDWRRRRGRETEPLEAHSEAAADSRPPEEQVMTNDLTAYIAAELERFAATDSQAAQVMQMHLFGAEDGEPLGMPEVIGRLELKSATAYRALRRAQEYLRTILRQVGVEVLKGGKT